MHIISCNYAKIKVDSDDFLNIDFSNVTIHIKSVWNKDQNYYYYNIFWYIEIKDLSFNLVYAMSVIMYWWCLWIVAILPL